jgi:hypothetical protein
MLVTYNGNILNFNGTIVTNYSIRTPEERLDEIASYLRNFITTDLRNPNFFEYNLDGNQYIITDGGNDMFDNGNYTAPWLLSNIDYTAQNSIPIPPSLSYNVTTKSVIDTDFYYVSLGYSTSPDRRPLTMLGTRLNQGNPIGFQKAGNIGADGGGQIVFGNLYVGETINGFTVYAYYRQTYGQSSDPAICDVYILLGHPLFGSQFDSIASFSQSSTQIQGAYFYAFGPNTKNILSITTLLSRPSNQPISENDIKSVIQNYALRISEVL